MAKTFFRCLAVLLLTAACSPRHTQDLRERTVTLSCVQPAFLQPGDKIALLSPSYHTPMENVYRGKYAGKPKARVSDLEWALKDPSIKAILCNRGGYGTIRLVDLLPQEELTAHPKWLVGYSDITTLLEMETRAGVMSIHGTMGTHLAQTRGNDPSSTLLRDLLPIPKTGPGTRPASWWAATCAPSRPSWARRPMPPWAGTSSCSSKRWKKT